MAVTFTQAEQRELSLLETTLDAEGKLTPSQSLRYRQLMAKWDMTQEIAREKADDYFDSRED